MNLTLKREEAAPLQFGMEDRGSWPLTISAFYDAEMTQPAKVFVYQRAGLGSSLNGDSFSCFASILQMSEIPEDAPTSDCPYFRVAVATLICRSQQHALGFWNEALSAAQHLIDEEAAASVVTVTSTVTLTPS